MRVIVKGIMFLTISAVLLLTSCATNRSVVSLNMPDLTVVAQENGRKVFIESVSDQRVFQENPKTQDIPSLGFGGAKSSTDEIKKRAIGRKRNGFGKAIGDILLDENQSVETVIENAIKQSFEMAGYSIVNDEKGIDNDTILVDVEIEKFWAYMRPGFWAITLSSDISTDLKLTKKSITGLKVEKITVKSEGKYQVATESNWMEIVGKALSQYINVLKELISNKINLM